MSNLAIAWIVNVYAGLKALYMLVTAGVFVLNTSIAMMLVSAYADGLKKFELNKREGCKETKLKKIQGVEVLIEITKYADTEEASTYSKGIVRAVLIVIILMTIGLILPPSELVVATLKPASIASTSVTSSPESEVR